MIVKRAFNPVKVASYVWRDTVLALGAALVVWALYEPGGQTVVALPFAPIGLLGTALSIFLAFRANTSFARWGEASQAWATIISASRTLARLVITFADAHQQTPAYDRTRAEAFKREVAHRHLAWAHALRLQLRGQDDWPAIERWLTPAEAALVAGKSQRAGYLLKLQGDAIYRAMASGVLQGFDSFQLEGQLATLGNAQALCERIKQIPIPRQYDYFTRLFVRIFLVVLPFCLVGAFAGGGAAWLVLPAGAVLAFIFTTIERTGAINEEPFEQRVTDVPLSAYCRTIERDIAELLDDAEVPPPLIAQHGYLF